MIWVRSENQDGEHTLCGLSDINGSLDLGELRIGLNWTINSSSSGEGLASPVFVEQGTSLALCHGAEQVALGGEGKWAHVAVVYTGGIQEQLDIYEQYFMPFGVGPRQFRHFWNLGETCEVPESTKLAVTGEPYSHVELVLSGRVRRLTCNKHIPGLDSVPGFHTDLDGRRHTDVEGSDGGAWVGELRALQLLGTVSAPNAVNNELCRRQLAEVVDTDEERVLHSSEYWDNFGMTPPADGVTDVDLDKLLNRSKARWDVQAGADVVVRRWKLKPLLQTCMTDHDLAGLLGKVWSQSVIQKMLALDAAQMELPSVVLRNK